MADPHDKVCAFWSILHILYHLHDHAVKEFIQRFAVTYMIIKENLVHLKRRILDHKTQENFNYLNKIGFSDSNRHLRS